MNYLNNPNYLGNYPYGYMNQYNQYVPPQPQQFLSQQSQPPQPLNGKIVDSADVVKATEVPIGSYGIFPKADLSEIYIKSWNNNGTTNIMTFKPVMQEQPTPEGGDLTNLLLKKIEGLENKIDMFLAPQTVAAPAPTEVKKTEVIKNGF